MTRIPMIAFLTVSAAAATAQAQPAPAPAPAPAPVRAAEVDAQNRADDISTINSQLVEVGDHNRYRFSYRKWNVSTNPIGLVIGSYGASLSYAFSEHVALRGDLNYYEPVESDASGFEVGVGAPIYFRKMYSGLFLEPGVISRKLTSSEDGATTVGPQVLVGYHWYWDSGFNVAAAAGVGRNWNTSDEDEASEPELFPNAYLRFGYAF
jgi:hypothetical protein